MSNLEINNKSISKPIVEILKIIKSKLTNGKLKDIRVRSDNIRVSCPFHKDGLESRPSCDIYIGNSTENVTYGDFHCFTCGEKGPFYKFVAECFDKDDNWAKTWLLDNFSDGIIERELDLDPIVISKSKKSKLDERMLDSFKDYHPYMQKRKLSRKVCETFKVRYDDKTQSLVFPVWDDKGDLVMLTRRSVNDKTFIIDKDKEKPVYLLNYIKKNNIKEATLCESQINTLTLWGWGIPSIATFGCNVTDKQIELINKSGINHLYICFDGDEAGIHGTKNLIESLDKKIIIDVILMDRGKDVNDLDEERFNKLPIIDGNDWKTKMYNK